MTYNEKCQYIYDTYLLCDKNVKVTASIVGLSHRWAQRIAMRYNDKHHEAISKMQNLSKYIITDAEVLERYFYNTKYKVNRYGVIINHE